MNAKEISDLITNAPTVEAVPTIVISVDAHQVVGSITESHIPGDTSQRTVPREEHTSGSFLRGSTPGSCPSYCILEPDLGASSSTTGEYLLPSIGLRQLQRKDRPCPIPYAGSDHYNITTTTPPPHTPSRG